MLILPEERAVALLVEHVGPRVDPGGFELFLRNEGVAHLVARVAEHQHDLFRAARNAAQADGEPVAAEDGEDHADGVIAEFGADVLRDVVGGGVVALRLGDDRLGHAHDVAVVEGKALACGGFEHGIGDDLREVVPRPDNRGAHAPDSGTDHS